MIKRNMVGIALVLFTVVIFAVTAWTVEDRKMDAGLVIAKHYNPETGGFGGQAESWNIKIGEMIGENEVKTLFVRVSETDYDRVKYGNRVRIVGGRVLIHMTSGNYE